MNRNLLVSLLLLIVPAAAQASSYSGPPATFVGLGSNLNAYLKVDLMKEGKFTGDLDLVGGPHSAIKGTLDLTGSFSGTATTGATPYTLQLTGTNPSTYLLTGSAAGYTISAFPLAYSKGQTASEEGRYNTFVISSGTGTVPRGFGWAVLSVGKTGAGRISGKLPDGTGFSASSNMVADGTTAHLLVLEDRNLYNKGGVLLGYIGIETGITGADFVWQKPITKGPYYPAAFSTIVTAEGFLYSKAKGIPFTSGTIEFASAALATTGTQTFTVSSKGVATVNSPNPSHVKLSINPATGAVTGSFDFPHMVAGKSVNSIVKYSGLLLQSGTTGAAYGYFIPCLSG
jgi:hypothetical protein